VKVLVVGNWEADIHEKAVFQAFQVSAHNVYKFSWNEYFNTKNDNNFLSVLFKRIQRKYMIGPSINKMNSDFLTYAEKINPDIIFIYRGTHIFQKTLAKIHQEINTFILGYNNDDPFSLKYSGWEWRHFINCIPEYDLTLSYRNLNIKDYWKAGAKDVRLLRSWFIPERNYPVKLTNEEIKRFGCDVVFIGHYEADGRKEMLEKIVRSGVDLKIYGPGWEKVTWNIQMPKNIFPIKALGGLDYNKALNAAKIALCFFSTLNRDSYTRRCFEIPASGTLLLSEYSSDLADLYLEDKEAVFFRNSNELLKKIELYISEDELRSMIAKKGRNRAIKDGYDVVSRIGKVANWCTSYQKEGDEKK
jgi:spore maturation protein CgeB